MILSVLLMVATMSGRLTSSARCGREADVEDQPAFGVEAHEPLPFNVPVPAWKVRRWICSVSPWRTRRPWPPLSFRPDSGIATAPPSKSTVPVPVIFWPATLSVRLGRSRPVMLRTSLPSSGAKGAMSTAPPSAIWAATVPPPRGRVAVPFTVKLVLAPADSRASRLACWPTREPVPRTDRDGTSAVSGRRTRTPVAV